MINDDITNEEIDESVNDFISLEKAFSLMWISIYDKLPECNSQHSNIFESRPVLVFSNGEISIDRFCCEYTSGSNGYEKPVYKWVECDNVTHWMGLPEEPETKLNF
jgi:Protein of unknown function (DUF551)